MDNSKYIYNGIDRVNNNFGYLIDNCVTCCTNCNVAKMARTQEEFNSWNQRVYEHKVMTGQIKPSLDFLDYLKNL
jgi:hypothetical protein